MNQNKLIKTLDTVVVMQDFYYNAVSIIPTIFHYNAGRKIADLWQTYNGLCGIAGSYCDL